MRLSRETEYGLRALIGMARRPPTTVQPVGEIAAHAGLPAGFLAKIFQKFTRHGLVRSHRGRVRGYSLGRDPGEITLRQVVEATEGPEFFQRCLFWDHRCGESNPCLLHCAWQEIKPHLTVFFDATTLASLAESGGENARSL